MLADVAASQSHVRLASYIWADDDVGRRFAHALLERHVAGVSVRVAVDAFGSIGWPRHRALVRLAAAGVPVTARRPARLRSLLALHRRDHRKLLVCDADVAYLGGFNLHRQSSLLVYGRRRWRDTHVRIAGPLAADCAHLFDQMIADRRTPDVLHAGAATLWTSGRRRCRRKFHCVLLDAIEAAAHRVWLTTPYFVPDRALRAALRRAARRGVDVQLLVPGVSDVPLVSWAGHSRYAELLRAGVRLYEYGGRVLHAKTALVDDAWSSVGTANLDHRSFFLNDELTLVVHGAEVNAALARQFQHDLADAAAVSLRQWHRRSSRQRWRERLAWQLRRWL